MTTLDIDKLVEELQLKKDAARDSSEVRRNTTASRDKINLNINFNKDSFIQGIIYSELLGKPRCKRGRRRGR